MHIRWADFSPVTELERTVWILGDFQVDLIIIVTPVQTLFFKCSNVARVSSSEWLANHKVVGSPKGMNVADWGFVFFL